MRIKLNLIQTQKLKVKMKPAMRIVIFSSAVLLFAFFIAFMYANFGTSKKSFAGLGMHGAKTVSTTNIILNEFTTLSADVSAGATSITVAGSSLNANSRFSGALEVGSLVMIVQMQGATMNTASPNASTWGAITAYNNCGKFEFDEVAAVPSGTSITLVSPLKNSYSKNGKTQIIRVPRYTDFTINTGASVTTQAWDGSTGGVLAVEANGFTVINGTVDVTGKGFRGGATENNTSLPGNHVIFASASNNDGAEKGESIGGTQTTYDGLGGRFGRGAPANGGGGGNSHNACGGGGANGGVVAGWNGLGNPDNSVAAWTTAWNQEAAGFSANVSSGGGRGGYSYSIVSSNPQTKGPGNTVWGGDYRFNVGGYGGRVADYTGSRIFMGGGGGAGDANDMNGTAGAAGGGIIYLLTGKTLSGTGTINANGANVPNSVSPVGTNGDGSGGGGGGGSVFIYSITASVTNITINAKGGNGGNQLIASNPEAEGGGGSGGGGYISTTNPVSLTRNTNGGVHGNTNSISLVNFLPNGGTSGGVGTIVSNPLKPYSGSVPLPITLKSFSAVEDDNIIVIKWTTASEENNDYFTIERSTNGYDFSVIGKMNGAGNSRYDMLYSFPDDSPVSGDCYYRLTQTDFDGNHETFPAVHIKTTMTSTIANRMVAAPSMFEDHVRIDYRVKEAGVVQFQIVNRNGQVMKTENASAGEGNNSYEMNDLASLFNGMYIVVMRTATETRTVKVTKI